MRALLPLLRNITPATEARPGQMRGVVIGEDDLGEATTVMGRCLFHRQWDLLIETWSLRTDASSLDRQSRDH